MLVVPPLHTDWLLAEPTGVGFTTTVAVIDEPTQKVGVGPVGVIVNVTVTGALVVLVKLVPVILVPEPLAAIPVTAAVLSLVHAKVVPVTELLVLNAIVVKLVALHIVWPLLVAVATGIGVTVASTVNAEPAQVLAVGVTVYLLTPPAALVKVWAIVVPQAEAQLAAPVIVPDTAACVHV